MASVDDVRELALSLPRTTEQVIRDRIRFRVARIVYLALSPDEATVGFAFPREERDALVAADPERFFLPQATDLRYHWVCAHLETLTDDELHDLVVDAWRTAVPKRVYAQWHQGVS